MSAHENYNKKRDLETAYQKIKKHYETFTETGIVYTMERKEVESLIQQMNRLAEKIKKITNIYSTDKQWLR